MIDKRYVQHVSAVGDKWKVYTEHGEFWRVHVPNFRDYKFDLPKSEYKICEPPEQWVDVTEHCVVWPEQDMYPFGIRHNGVLINKCGHENPPSYRLRKVQYSSAILYDDKGNYLDGDSSCCWEGWAFKVEKKQP